MYICQEYWKQVQNSPKYYLSSQTHTDNLHCFSSVFKGYDFTASLNLSQNDKLIYFMEVNWNRQLSMHDTGNLFKEILY